MFAVEEQHSGPGEQVDAGEGELKPRLVDGKVAGREPAEARVLAGADPVLDPRVGAVTQLEELDRPAAAWSVGGEDLVTQAFDAIEQAQLGAGVGAFAAHDQPGA